uniref:BEN domain-containing protein n=1 Tax=Macrostomum lignano TaxID=282301 RepID=A0A1I8FG55_9PLAT
TPVAGRSSPQFWGPAHAPDPSLIRHNPARRQEASKPVPASAAEAPARNAKSELCAGTSGAGDLASAAAGGREERKEILQPVASSVGATSAVTAALEQTGELTALRTMNARLAEENRQLRQRVDQLMAQNSDLSARLQQMLAARFSPGFSAAGRLADSARAAPPPLSPASSAAAAAAVFADVGSLHGPPDAVVPPTVPESSAVDEAAAAEARSDGDGEGEGDADVLTPVGQQLDINVDEAAEGGGAAACSAAAAATAVDDGDADYDQPPAETDEEDNEMCNETQAANSEILLYVHPAILLQCRPIQEERGRPATEAITSEDSLQNAGGGSQRIAHDNFLTIQTLMSHPSAPSNQQNVLQPAAAVHHGGELVGRLAVAAGSCPTHLAACQTVASACSPRHHQQAVALHYGERFQFGDDVILIRIYGEKTELIIDRQAEVRNMRLLHLHGFCKPVYATFANGPLLRIRSQEIRKSWSGSPPLADWLPESWPACTAAGAISRRRIRRPSADGLRHHAPLLELGPDEIPRAGQAGPGSALSLPDKAALRAEVADLEAHLCAAGLSCGVQATHDTLIKNFVYDRREQRVFLNRLRVLRPQLPAVRPGQSFQRICRGAATVDHSRYPSREFQLPWLRNYLQYRDGFLGGGGAESLDSRV